MTPASIRPSAKFALSASNSRRRQAAFTMEEGDPAGEIFADLGSGGARPRASLGRVKLPLTIAVQRMKLVPIRRQCEAYCSA